MSVLHLGDISGTSRNVIDVARAKGLDWTLRDVPAGRGSNPARIAWLRLKDLVAVRLQRPRPVILHINYGVSGYYGWGRRGVVLHLHGTDVRSDMVSRYLGPAVRRSVKTADVVLYSTPDLAAAVRAIRPDAQWLPAPLPTEAENLLEPALPRTGRRVFFASRWDDSKGAPELLALAARLHREFPELELVGLDWGTHAAEAREIGMTLLPHMSTGEFRAQLAQADVVVGQLAVGALGLSDLEAMAQARPLVAKFTLQEEYGSEAPLFNSATRQPFALIQEILANPQAASLRSLHGREWALSHHSASILEARLESLYESILA
ncbi:glycosyltransferase family protein [Arthrobacter sp. Sr24]